MRGVEPVEARYFAMSSIFQKASNLVMGVKAESGAMDDGSGSDDEIQELESFKEKGDSLRCMLLFPIR